MKFSTKLIHGNEKLDSTGATNTPVYFSNAYAHNTSEKLESIFKGTAMGYAYSRISNPTVNSFERRIASVEGGLAATATASGMSAIYLAVKNIVEVGDEIISASGLFGGTYTLFRNLKSDGIETKFLESLDEDSLEKALTSRTKIVFAETIGNPKLDILDIESVGEFCKKNNIIFIVDSTLTTPYLINPIEYGADVVIHSTSKYINGTSNSIGGVIIDGGSSKFKSDKFESFKDYAKKFGKMAFTGKLRDRLGKDLGATLSPMSAFLNLTGIETLSLRLRQHCENALSVAEFLEGHEKVDSVNYPKLKSSPYYNLAKKYYDKGASGILTFRLGTKENAFKFINDLKLIVNLPNVGDTKTLIIHPSSTICINNSEEEKLQMGVYDDLVRLSVGIEDIEDIIADINDALKGI